MKIVLLRHGKVKHPPISIISASSFKSWVDAYNFNGLDASSIPSEEAIHVITKSNAVVCSELLRSHESATVLGAQNIVFKSPLFNEAGLPIANWKYPKLSVRMWVILFRVLWLCGYSKDSESIQEANTRAQQAVAILIELAEKHDSIAFVGHGVFNRMLASKLRASGWDGPRSPGSKHWGYGVYKKII